ncbi:MAG: glycoside hydrolase family 28 [Candidatus Nephrothrix sp. EaCA]|nr:MAG: glycoside hydrolase family 28 [Candidatus Nephrothrix sp. EaCA]
MKTSLWFLFVLFFGKAFGQQRVLNITALGAVGDGRTNNTLVIQKAIDSVSSMGGGRVLLPNGKFLAGVLHLRTGVDFHIAEGGTLLGSTKRTDYGGVKASALIEGNNLHRISITGNGTIDGQGREVVQDVDRMLKEGSLQDPQWQTYNPWHQKRSAEFNRPHLVTLSHCDQVTISGVLFKDAACWVQTYQECTNLTLDSVRVQSTAYYNNDGIDIVDCRNVKVINCSVNAGDDGICLKSSNPNALCENVLVANCTIRSSASALKFGTASHGGFRNITVRNLSVYDTYRSAIALMSVDGGILENVTIENIKAKNTGNAIFIRLGHRKKETAVGRIKGVVIRNIEVEVPSDKPDKGYEMEGPEVLYAHNVFPASITGLSERPVEDITLENLKIIYGGGSEKKAAHFGLDSLARVPENVAEYPEFSMFGELPCWALYVRHAAGIRLRNVVVQYKKDDFRPAFVFDDVRQLELSSVSIQSAKTAPVIVLREVPKPSLKMVKYPMDSKTGVLTIDHAGKRKRNK